MKLMFFSYSLRMGGAERVLAGLAGWLNRAGHEVTCVTMSDDAPFYPLEPGVMHVRLGLPGRKGLFGALRNRWSIMRALRREITRLRPDVLYSSGGDTVVTMVLAAAGLPVRVVGSEVTNPFIQMNHSWKESVRRRATRFFSRMTAGYVFQTARAAAYYPGRVQRRAAVIQNPVYIRPRDDLRTPDSHEICTVGRMIACKGFDDLIRAFARFRQTHPDYRLVLYGDGPELEPLRQLAQSCAPEAVNFPGRVQDVAEKLARAEMFVLSSHLEGLPNTLVEAMACGLPCVATDCPMGPAELIRDGENGLLVPVSDTEAMARAMARIADDPAFARRLGAAAAKIRQTNSEDAIGREFEAYFAQVCAQTRRGK